MNPMDKYNQLMEGIRNPGSLDKGLAFGQPGMMGPAYAPSSGITPNAYGVTGVTDNNTGAGFHGNPEHFAFGDPFKPVPAGYVPFNPEWGVDQNPETGNVGLPSSPPPSEGEQPPAGVGGEAPDFTSNYDPRGQATPFLDAYIRSKEAAKAEGPVTGMMKKYME
jgi:hypothetical protein